MLSRLLRRLPSVNRELPKCLSPFPAQRRFFTGITGDKSLTGDSVVTGDSALSEVAGSSSLESYLLVYTCVKCDVRNSKKIAKNAYHKGVVLCKCDGCKNMHLIADNLGWFGEESFNVEKAMEKKGQAIYKGLVDIES
jgi:mitochondrial protein import protein ZIM17